ncbi:MAG: hypothetical protein GXX99_08420 [Clostridiales bacterium]|nr:hypothetical protein [Clostridiales bacterium]
MKKVFTALAALMLAGACLLSVPALPASGAAAEPADICLHIGSPIALSKGVIVSLDSENPRLAPILHKDRTMVPLRAIAEHFGAKVQYDAADRSAVIEAGGRRAVFPIGEAYFALDGKRQALDVETLLDDGRVLAPIRAVCEQLLGLEIAFENGVVQIGEAVSLTAERAGEVKQKIGRFVRAQRLEDLLEAYKPENAYRLLEGGIAIDMPAAMPEDDSGIRGADLAAENSAEAPVPAPTGEAQSIGKGADDSASADYATTNIQTAGVDEGDIIKTDGKRIYLCSGRQLKVISAEGGQMAVLAERHLGDDAYAEEMYVDGNLIVVTGSRSLSSSSWGGRSLTFVRVYELTEAGQLELGRVYEIEGRAVTTRRMGDYVYLLTSHYGYGRTDPRPYYGEGGGMQPMPLDCILLPTQPLAQGMSTLSAINIRDRSQPVSSETVVGGGQTYMSTNAFYLANTTYGSSYETSISRFSVKDGRVGYIGSGNVYGNINDQFSLDEYKGYLRVATSAGWPSVNHLFVLDENMEVCGKVLGYAPDERIYSARFMGDRGYVVTFRETDPLFVFDLSDPRDPKITGELKVPGFSNYLHPVSEHVLLGVGYDVGDLIYRAPDGSETVVGQRQGGIKLSLFDVSDMGKPREISTLVLGSGGHSELMYNHKAAMFKADEGLLAFPTSLYANSGGEGAFDGIALISYAGDKLSERGRLAYVNPYDSYKGSGNCMYVGMRAIYIGDTLYFLQDGLLRAFDLGTLAERGSLSLVELSA